MTNENSVYEDLSPQECLELLGQASLGRIAVIENNQPIIFPVNYAFDDGTIVFRTDPGTKLATAPLARVAFEIDEVDTASRSGWSVVVQGVGEDITDSVDTSSDRLLRLTVDTWVPGGRDHWVKIVPRSITGRRLRTVATAAPAGAAT
jgi:uncharacterized protein